MLIGLVLQITLSFLYKDIESFESKVSGFIMILLLLIWWLARVVPLIWLASQYQLSTRWIVFGVLSFFSLM